MHKPMERECLAYPELGNIFLVTLGESNLYAGDFKVAGVRTFDADETVEAQLTLLPLDETDVPRLQELMREHRDRSMDLADAALVRAAERDGLETVFTLNRGAFEAYRIRGRRRFRIIPERSA